MSIEREKSNRPLLFPLNSSDSMQLWSGNKGKGIIGGSDGPIEEVVFDPSACYAHSEYELGIMRMFGGFGGSFMKEYHDLCPKTEPVAEYEDRVSLYEL